MLILFDFLFLVKETLQIKSIIAEYLLLAGLPAGYGHNVWNLYDLDFFANRLHYFTDR